VLATASNGNTNYQVDYSPGSEDFAFNGKDIQPLYYWRGIGFPMATNHSPYFVVDEASLAVVVRAQAMTAVHYLFGVARSRR
jgi:metal-dependent amidase/aminoacylase/carboxypeptidase family protein